MLLNIPKIRKARKDALYSRDKLNVISKYKEEYRQQTTHEMRGQVFKTKILVDIFNFWLAQGEEPVDEAEMVKHMKVNFILIDD